MPKEVTRTNLMIWPDQIDLSTETGNDPVPDCISDTSEMCRLLQLYFVACRKNAAIPSYLEADPQESFEEWYSKQDFSRHEADIEAGIINFIKVRTMRIILKNRFLEADIPVGTGGKVEIKEQLNIPMLIIRCTHEFYQRIIDLLKNLPEISDFDIGVSPQSSMPKRQRILPKNILET